MKRIIFIIFFAIISIISLSQSMETLKVVIVNDSIKEMSRTNGRQQLLIPAPLDGKSIIIQSIDVRNKVVDRLYSANESDIFYHIGYRQGNYWYDIATIDFDNLNSKGNTTFFNSATITSRLWEESKTNAAPVYIKFNKPANFTTGNNRLTLYITYRILN